MSDVRRACSALLLILLSVGPTPLLATQTSQGERTPRRLEQAIQAEINRYRRSLDLAPLEIDVEIRAEARAHSRRLASRGEKLSHRGFDRRARRLRKSTSYSALAENVAANQGHSDPARTATTGWLKSRHHRHNIVGEFDRTGIGVARSADGVYYFTQIFLLSDPGRSMPP